MCDALRELFGEELTNAIAAGVEAGIKEQLPIAVEERVAEVVEERVAEVVEERVAEVVEERVSEVLEERVAEARKESIHILISDYMEEGFSRNKILGKLKKHFGLTELEARGCFERFLAG